MANKSKTTTAEASPTLLSTPRNCSNGVKPSRDYPEVLERPATTMGKLLASQCVDGVRLGVNTLLRGQFDDKFGEVDPMSDIHSDRHLLADAVMRSDMASSALTSDDIAAE